MSDVEWDVDCPKIYVWPVDESMTYEEFYEVLREALEARGIQWETV